MDPKSLDSKHRGSEDLWDIVGHIKIIVRRKHCNLGNLKVNSGNIQVIFNKIQIFFQWFWACSLFLVECISFAFSVFVSEPFFQNSTARSVHRRRKPRVALAARRHRSFNGQIGDGMMGAFSFVCLWLLLASHVLFASGKCRFVTTCRREHVWKLACVFLLWCLKISCFYLCKVFLRSNVCEIDTWRWKRLCKFHIRSRRLYVKEFLGQASFFAKSECQNVVWWGLLFIIHTTVGNTVASP